MSGQDIIAVGDVHMGYDLEGAKERLGQWGTFDYTQLARDALNYMIMGDMVDGPLESSEIIECTDYREVPPEPLLLPAPKEEPS